MEQKHIHFIINESSDSENVESIIDELFEQHSLSYHVSRLKNHADIAALAQQMKASRMVAVYGGDGTVTEVAKVLIGTEVPLAIIPGGTANVLSKELQIPQDTISAIKLLAEDSFQLKNMDTGLVNGTPFLLRVNLGIMADMITDVNPTVKEHAGQLAYGLSAIKAVSNAEPHTYQLIIDGEGLEVSAVSLTVTNSGHMGVGNLQMHPGISVTDGLLDLVLLKNADVLTLVKAAGSSLMDKETEAVNHYPLKKINIKMSQPESYICDDCEAKADELTIEVVPSSLRVVVPLTHNK